jgi:XTP/dITP diphosphohydrolase
LPSDRILSLATSNLHKIEEAATILAEFRIRVHRIESPKVEIQSDDIVQIASFASDDLSRRYSGLVAVEDSGLFVDSLKGFPGPFSSYAYQAIGPSGILRLLGTSSRRGARFRAAVAVSRSGHTLKTFTGEVRGRIAHSKRGVNGFGFDPIFIPTGTLRTFGEMSVAEKNGQSHRQNAFRQLGMWLTSSAKTETA